MPTPPLSVLDLAPVVEGASAADSFRNTRDLARHAEQWGYKRFWLAEHHNMPGIASSATAVLIGYVAEGTSSIRVGAGGVMLPNHSPLVIAEQFGTLESLYPGRIDLGLGRAPGTDAETDVRAAPRRRERGGQFSAGRSAAAGVLRARGARPACPRRARRRTARAGVAAGVELVQRATGRDARAAICVCVALRAGLPAGSARRLSARVSALRRRSSGRTPSRRSTSSPPTATPRRPACSPRCSSSSSGSDAERQASFHRPSIRPTRPGLVTRG